jgi:hypothetical protein
MDGITHTSVLLTRDELERFLGDVEKATGDPADATCLLFVRWRDETVCPPDMVASWDTAAGAVLLECVDAQSTRVIPLDVSTLAASTSGGALTTFHIRSVSPGVWALAPSLNIPGVIHAYVVLHGVPDPAPWERLVLLASEARLDERIRGLR